MFSFGFFVGSLSCVAVSEKYKSLAISTLRASKNKFEKGYRGLCMIESTQLTTDSPIIVNEDEFLTILIEQFDIFRYNSNYDIVLQTDFSDTRVSFSEPLSGSALAGEPDRLQKLSTNGVCEDFLTAECDPRFAIINETHLQGVLPVIHNKFAIFSAQRDKAHIVMFSNFSPKHPINVAHKTEIVGVPLHTLDTYTIVGNSDGNKIINDDDLIIERNKDAKQMTKHYHQKHKNYLYSAVVLGVFAAVATYYELL